MIRNLFITLYFDFTNKRFEKIKKSIKCTDEELLKVNELISVLNPAPAINYNVNVNQHIIPDISIDNIPGIMKADSHPSKLTKVPAINTPLPIPTPPKIPFIHKALPFFLYEFTPQATPTG